MTPHSTPTFETVDNALRALGAGEGATEAHGSLCGLTCVLGARARGVWMASLDMRENPDNATGGPDRDVLDELVTRTRVALTEGDMTFAPLLPPDDAPLSLRAEALASWCAGFMYGLGEAVGAGSTQDALASETSREIIDDFAEISRITLGEEETDLEAESAYAELVEFVRVSVQLIFEELYDVRQGPASSAVH